MKTGPWLTPALLFLAPLAAAPPSRPNVILILADDLGYGDLSCFRQETSIGDSPALTPHIDSLAAQGVKFTQAYAPQMCSPSRASLLTGRYSQRFGFYENQDAAVGLPKSELTLAELLAANGYATACIGKWHLGHRPGFRPLDRGFDRFYGFLGAAHDYFKPSVGTDTEGAIHEGSFVYDQGKPVPAMNYLTDQLADVAIDFIDRSQQAGRPFFLYLPFNAPHDVIHATLLPNQDEWAVRVGDWKLVQGQDSLRPGTIARPLATKSPRVTGLYRLTEDPFERRSLIEQFPDRAAALREVHRQFMSTCPPSIAQVERRAGNPN